MQEFLDRFLNLYNSIPAQLKPPIGSAQLQYVEYFDSDFTLCLSERRSTSLEAMMKDAIEMEVNLSAARKNRRDEGEWIRDEGEGRREEGEWRREEGERGERRKDKELEQPSTSSSQEAIIDMMLIAIERMMERLFVDGRPPPRENQEQQNRNQNARRPQILQNKQRDQ